ncbi:hypothetical protein SOVF_043440 isoform A [Spinacia oleracea]|nr:hypothetical protein SOVF_043440 isoform A [Spinacia oleracea]
MIHEQQFCSPATMVQWLVNSCILKEVGGLFRDWK